MRTKRTNRSLDRFITGLSSRIPEETINRAYANPVFIVSAPRSGSTLLYELLSNSPDIWTIGGESHGVFAQFPHLVAENEAFDSGRLGAVHADQVTARRMRLFYLAMMKDNAGNALLDRLAAKEEQPINFLEKTPRNSLNIEFLLTVFPSARFIFLHRSPEANISSIIEGWELGARSGQFVTFPDLPDWPLGYWCFLLPPGWRDFKHKSIAEIAAFQWQSCNEIILRDFSALAPDRWIAASYEDLIANPCLETTRLCEFCGIDLGEYILTRTPDNLPLSPSTITPPGKGKWRRHEQQITPLLPSLENTIDKINKINTLNK